MRFDGIDLDGRQIRVTFDYDLSQDEEVLKFAKEKLGEEVSVNEMSTYIEELQEEL